ncbi:MAG: polysaccharide deacetylase family protein [Flavobacteriales bacterium]|jgi:peptidoglycan/xylan/chitin deacetylase (PgdA/CDA1 family)|nr:polysaccharide deacetylase family protein [Flavobacteriales bacterium]
MIRIPKIVRVFFPSVLWKVDTTDQVVYFTFDDGPTPKVTEDVLSILASYNAKATFFCLGNRVEQYPAVYQKIVDAGHTVGNHTQQHLKGWRSINQVYFEDVEKASEKIASKLFRPPYGKMRWSQYRFLKKNYRVVLWDVIPEDYLKSMTVQKLVSNIVNHVSAGSIVVLHDSEKCASVMLEALPEVLKQLSEKGFEFKAIEDEI